MFLALGIATVIYIAVALGMLGTLAVQEVIASAAPPIALLVFARITTGHLRIRHETAANLALLVAAVATTIVVLAAFAITTLASEPATIAAIVCIVALQRPARHHLGAEPRPPPTDDGRATPT